VIGCGRNVRIISVAPCIGLALGVVVAPALGQTEPGASVDGALTIRMVADEETLWLLRSGSRDARVYRRKLSEPFAATPALSAPIVSAVAAEGALYAFVDSGDLYAQRGTDWRPELNLPRRALPVNLAASGNVIYALVPSPDAGEVAHRPPDPPAPETQPFEPGDAPLSVLQYDADGWLGIAPAPGTITADQRPRLAVIQDSLCLFWRPTEPDEVAWVRLDETSGAWTEPQRLSLQPVRDFWVTRMSGVPIIIAAGQTENRRVGLTAVRLLGDITDGSDAWRPLQLQLSELPEGTRPIEYEHAVGFNQHVALLVTDSEGAVHVQFGRGGAAPAEATVAVAEIFAGEGARGAKVGLLQTATLVVLFGILMALFLLRRDAMVQPVRLPPDGALALTIQRVLGGALDLVPFLLVMAAIVGVDWQDGLRELLSWAMGSDATTGRLPPSDILLWWGSATAAYSVYCLLMEILTARTIGKVLTGTRVMAESAGRASVGQIVVRNFFRFLELQPPLWVLIFLLVLSRNRQRVGDIFARTVVLRRVTPKPTDDQDKKE
jgi:uncharacterized RDD family membrane protein YckC